MNQFARTLGDLIYDDEYGARIKSLASLDVEGSHHAADALLCELLEKLGYEKTVEAFRSLTKWYA